MFRLGIDYGTSSTVAILAWPDGQRRPLLFDGSPLLPSAVYADADRRLLTGRDAMRAARIDPAGLDPNPKRRIDDGEVLLGGGVYPVTALIAATLARVWQEAVRTAGTTPSQVVLTVPAAWGNVRRTVVRQAAQEAGIPDPVLVAEPVAAACYFAQVRQHEVPPGRCVVVYDLGAGTFDVGLVRRSGAAFEVLACGGLDTFGGLDLDDAMVRLAGTGLPAGADPHVWQSLVNPQREADLRLALELRDSARDAKEELSRRPVATMRVPLLETTVHVTREQFDSVAAPLLRRTVDLTLETVRSARISPPQLAGVFLVGGSTRLPLVATLLHRSITVAPLALEQPELVVAEGALLLAPTPAPTPTPAGVRTGQAAGHADDRQPPAEASFGVQAPTPETRPRAGTGPSPFDLVPVDLPRSARSVNPAPTLVFLALLTVLLVGVSVGIGYAGSRSSGKTADAGTPDAHATSASAAPATAASSPTAAPNAPQPDTGEASITLSTTTGKVGTPFTVTGRGFAPNKQIRVRFGTVVVAQVVSDANGGFTAEGRVPATYAHFTIQVMVVAEQSNPVDFADAPFDLVQ